MGRSKGKKQRRREAKERERLGKLVADRLVERLNELGFDDPKVRGDKNWYTPGDEVVQKMVNLIMDTGDSVDSVVEKSLVAMGDHVKQRKWLAEEGYSQKQIRAWEDAGVMGKKYETLSGAALEVESRARGGTLDLNEVLKMGGPSDHLFRLPGPQSGGLSISSGRKLIVELYTRTLVGLAQESVPLKNADGDGENHLQLKRKLWGYMNEASIFAIPLMLFQTLYHQADMEVCRLAGVEWASPFSDPIPPDEGMQYWEVCLKEGRKVAWPEHMPFEFMWFGFDQPWELNENQVGIFHIPQLPGAQAYWHFGYLVGKNEVFSAYVVEMGNHSTVVFSPERESEFTRDNPKLEWNRPGSLAPWIITWLIDWINSHKVTIEENTLGFSYRRDYKTSLKRLKVKKPIPPPYYTIYMRNQVIQRTEGAKSRGGVKFEMQHRTKVRKADCFRVKRGPLPLDPKLEEKLRKDKRRRIFKAGPMHDAEILAGLMERGIRPKSIDEWMAVLPYWRREHMRGPEGAPFIPAIRKSAKEAKKRRRRRNA